MPEQLDFSAYLENVKSQSLELTDLNNKDTATSKEKEKLHESPTETEAPTKQQLKPQRLVYLSKLEKNCIVIKLFICLNKI